MLGGGSSGECGGARHSGPAVRRAGPISAARSEIDPLATSWNALAKPLWQADALSEYRAFSCSPRRARPIFMYAARRRHLPPVAPAGPRRCRCRRLAPATIRCHPGFPAWTRSSAAVCAAAISSCSVATWAAARARSRWPSRFASPSSSTRARLLFGEMIVERVLERALAIEGRTRIDDLRRGTLDDVTRAPAYGAAAPCAARRSSHRRAACRRRSGPDCRGDLGASRNGAGRDRWPRARCCPARATRRRKRRPPSALKQLALDARVAVLVTAPLPDLLARATTGVPHSTTSARTAR